MQFPLRSRSLTNLKVPLRNKTKKNDFPELEKGQKNLRLQSILSFNQFSCCCYFCFCFIDEVKFMKNVKKNFKNLLNSETNFHRFFLATQKTKK